MRSASMKARGGNYGRRNLENSGKPCGMVSRGFFVFYFPDFPIKHSFHTQTALAALCAAAAFIGTSPAAFALSPQQQEQVRQLEQNKQYDELLRLIKPLAEKGDAKAQVALGSMYLFGFGVPRDLTQAKKWLKKAASQGDKTAKRNLKKLELLELLEE